MPSAPVRRLRSSPELGDCAGHGIGLLCGEGTPVQTDGPGLPTPWAGTSQEFLPRLSRELFRRCTCAHCSGSQPSLEHQLQRWHYHCDSSGIIGAQAAAG
jgi:hypothetical protein